jgi:hypothetical protein
MPWLPTKKKLWKSHRPLAGMDSVTTKLVYLCFGPRRTCQSTTFGGYPRGRYGGYKGANEKWGTWQVGVDPRASFWILRFCGWRMKAGVEGGREIGCVWDVDVGMGGCGLGCVGEVEVQGGYPEMRGWSRYIFKVWVSLSWWTFLPVVVVSIVVLIKEIVNW